MSDCNCGTCSKVVSNAGSARTSFLAGRALRMTKVAAASKGDLTVSAVAAQGPQRPLWLPGSQAPKWLDGRYALFSLFFWELSADAHYNIENHLNPIQPFTVLQQLLSTWNTTCMSVYSFLLLIFSLYVCRFRSAASQETTASTPWTLVCDFTRNDNF